jgi:hypothetical protein
MNRSYFFTFNVVAVAMALSLSAQAGPIGESV